MNSEREQKPLFTPLFDELPIELMEHHDSIVTTFDGTIKETGIEMVLNPKNGDVLRANLYNLFTGKITNYEPLARGRWSNQLRDLEEDSDEYQKLDRVAGEAKRQFEEWKTNGWHPPMREWSKARVSRAALGMGFVIMPWEWFDVKIINGNRGEEDEIERIQNRLERIALSQGSTLGQGDLAKVSSIISSKDSPRLSDKKKAPSKLRKQVDEDVERLLREDPEFRSKII